MTCDLLKKVWPSVSCPVAAEAPPFVTLKLSMVTADLSKCFWSPASCKFLCTTATLRFSNNVFVRECSAQPALLPEHLEISLKLVTLKEDVVH